MKAFNKAETPGAIRLETHAGLGVLCSLLHSALSGEHAARRCSCEWSPGHFCLRVARPE